MVLKVDFCGKGERGGNKKVQIPTRIPEKIVVALFSGILVNSGILVDYTVVSRYVLALLLQNKLLIS